MTWAFFRRLPEHVFPRNKGVPADTRGQSGIDLGHGRERFGPGSTASAARTEEIDWFRPRVPAATPLFRS